MHIPDGYLSPETAAAGFAIAVPVLAVASYRVKRVVTLRNVPTLSLLSATSFLIMMFNVPIPDGTTAHAIGATLIAILLGPWAATIGVSVALLFQALLFGDGGVLTLGVNIVNMAIIAPFVGFGLCRLISGSASVTSKRRIVAAFVGGYVGIVAASLAAGIELGIQPALFQAADGTPLYSPYTLAQAVPAMLFAHLLVAGPVEGVITAGVVAYMQRANVPLLELNSGRALSATSTSVPGAQASRRRALSPRAAALIAIGLMIVLTPLGLLASGEAFGESAPEGLQQSFGFIPQGLAQWNSFWQDALFPGYDFADSSIPWLGYVVSAIVGVLVIGATVYGVTWLISRRGAEPEDNQDTGIPLTHTGK